MVNREFTDRVSAHRLAYEEPNASPVANGAGDISGYGDGKFIISAGGQTRLVGSVTGGSLSGVVGLRDRIDAIAGKPPVVSRSGIYIPAPVTSGKIKCLFRAIVGDTQNIYVGGDRATPDLIYSVGSEWGIYYGQIDNWGTGKDAYSAFLTLVRYLSDGNDITGYDVTYVYLVGGQPPIVDARITNFPAGIVSGDFTNFYQPPVYLYAGYGYMSRVDNRLTSTRESDNSNRIIFYDYYHPEGGTGSGGYTDTSASTEGGYSFNANTTTRLTMADPEIVTIGTQDFQVGFYLTGPDLRQYKQGSQLETSHRRVPILPGYIRNYDKRFYADQTSYSVSSFQQSYNDYVGFRVSRDLKTALISEREYNNSTTQTANRTYTLFVSLDNQNTPTVVEPLFAGPFLHYNNQNDNLIGDRLYRPAYFDNRSAKATTDVTLYNFTDQTVTVIAAVPVASMNMSGQNLAYSYHPD